MYLASNAGITDPVTLCACVLHDTVEDTKTTYDELVTEFGKEIADVVMEVTDDKSLSKLERKKLQITHALHASRSAKIVKLCDKYSNLENIKNDPPTSWSPEMRKGYAVWCYAVFQNLRGAHPQLEEKLQKLFNTIGVDETDLDTQLEAYYSTI